MKKLGLWLFALGAIIAVVSFFMPTAVDSSGLSFAGTLNLGLLQTQMMVFHLGLASFLAGAVLYGTGEINEKLDGNPSHSVETKDVTNNQSEQYNSDNIPKVVGLIAILIGFIMLFGYFGSHPNEAYSNTNEIIANLDEATNQLNAETSDIQNGTHP